MTKIQATKKVKALKKSLSKGWKVFAANHEGENPATWFWFAENGVLKLQPQGNGFRGYVGKGLFFENEMRCSSFGKTLFSALKKTVAYAERESIYEKEEAAEYCRTVKKAKRILISMTKR